MLKYPTWMKIILYFGIAFFICLTCFFVYFLLLALLQLNIVGAIVLIPAILAMGYISKVGLLLFKFIPVVVEYTDSQFTITLNTESKIYSWSEIAKVNDYSNMQILQLVGRNGETLLAIDYICPKYIGFREAMNDSKNT